MQIRLMSWGCNHVVIAVHALRLRIHNALQQCQTHSADFHHETDGKHMLSLCMLG